MNERRWKATWREGDCSREYIFTGPESRMLARLDFQLNWLNLGQPVPREFELDEIEIQVSPQHDGMGRSDGDA